MDTECTFALKAEGRVSGPFLPHEATISAMIRAAATVVSLYFNLIEISALSVFFS